MIEAVRRNDPVRCPVCPRTVERRSRQQVYCSPRCRKRAGRGKSLSDVFKTPPRYSYSRHGTNPHKSASENNVLQRPKSQSSLFGKGPSEPDLEEEAGNGRVRDISTARH